MWTISFSSGLVSFHLLIILFQSYKIIGSIFNSFLSYCWLVCFIMDLVGQLSGPVGFMFIDYWLHILLPLMHQFIVSSTSYYIITSIAKWTGSLQSGPCQLSKWTYLLEGGLVCSKVDHVKCQTRLVNFLHSIISTQSSTPHRLVNSFHTRAKLLKALLI